MEVNKNNNECLLQQLNKKDFSRDKTDTWNSFFLTWWTIDLEYKYFPQNYANPDKMSLGQCYLEQILLSQMNSLVSYLCDMVKPISDYSHLQSSNVIILFLVCVNCEVLAT